ncbi:PEP-CTERM sorting domain-containing protein [Nostoc cf. edaphicum LEGE 07299]|uniref:PEP-CTERM sorting domain-containing protein n=1 Tax=Nostoc cf. edaphicum LEGE 07299 TaxID=2777974 RepID=A0ABR9TYG1_9NOSO|nr:PEP-CTERM sorting domain-containing protein [Nostoc edaphicum]MBE9104670.1 PEP-CTERM sorting domain-containing protein [Nostoc cf. edaphicum LEGE 07299]
MIGFKSTLLNATLAVAAALPLATAALFTSAGSAQAYTGGFTFDGKGTTAKITNTGITFTPDPGAIELGIKEGSFLNDTNGTIYNLVNATLPSDFIDIGDQDGVKLLSLTTLFAPTFEVTKTGTLITFTFNGLFEDQSQATVDVFFASLKKNAEALYNSGEIVNASFEGATIASVPEPAALLGLGAVGAVMAMSRRRKSILQ